MPRLGWGTGKDDDRGRSAPMQGVEYERPMDPGPFQVPNKRLHTEDPSGQSTYLPLSSHSHLAPGPLLFSSPNPLSTTSGSAGFSRWSYNSPASGQTGRQEDVQDVDMNHTDDENQAPGMGTREELVDVEMYSDSPLKTQSQPQSQPQSQSHAPGHVHQDGGHARITGETGAETEGEIKSSSSSSILRPISLNGVKKELKRRLKDHGLDRDRHDSSSRVGSGALVMRDDDVEDDEGDLTIDSETSTAPPTPTIKRRRPGTSRLAQKSGLSASHLAPSSSSSDRPINQYTLNMYNAPGQSMGNGMGVGVGDSRGKSWVDAELPYVFIGYVQFVFNASLTIMILTALFWFLWTIWGDVKDLRGVYSTEILQEISTCTNMYLINRCEPSTRIPAMESACQEWEHCMNRDPSVVSFTKVGAEVVAGVVGGFVDALSWRSLMALFGLFPLMIILTNSTLLNVRKKHQPGVGMSGLQQGYHPHPHAHPSYAAPQQLHPGYPPQQAQFHWPPPVMGLGGGEPGEKQKAGGNGTGNGNANGWFASSSSSS